MRATIKRIGLVLTLIVLVHTSNIGMAALGSSQANSSSELATSDIIQFSKDVERSLAKNRARVALISRSGREQSELPNGVEYTHVGFAVYSEITLQDGTTQRGYVIHNLYQKTQQLNQSELVQDYPVDFFSQATVLKTGVIIPSEALQSKILEVIFSSTYESLHNPKYSAISNPFNNQTQNCTEFVMNITQSAIYDTDDLVTIKQALKTYFDPYKIPYNPFSVILGSIFSEEISSTDHSGSFKTATFSSIKNYFVKNQLDKISYELEYNDI